MGRTAETCPWLREFDAHVKDIHTGEERIPWDMLPEDWTKIADYYDKDKWYDVPQMAEGHVIDEAKRYMTALTAYWHVTAMSVMATSIKL